MVGWKKGEGMVVVDCWVGGGCRGGRLVFGFVMVVMVVVVVVVAVLTVVLDVVLAAAVLAAFPAVLDIDLIYLVPDG